MLYFVMALSVPTATAVLINNFPSTHLMQMLTYGRVMPFLELFARIDAVDCDAIMETAKEFIIDKVDLLRVSL